MTFLDDAASADPLAETAAGVGAETAHDRFELVASCVFVTAVLAAFSGVRPTGTSWWDGLLVASLAAIYVAAASRCHPYVKIAAAGLAAMFVGATPWLAVAGGGLLVAMLALMRTDRAFELRALSGGLSFLALLQLQNTGFFGSSAMIAGCAVLAVLISGYARSDAKVQSRVRSAFIGLSLVMMVVFVIAAYMAVSIRTTANAGVQSARDGLSSARAGDTQQLSIQLERAQLLLGEANDRISSPLLQPLKLVPVAAQHLRSVSTATEQGLLVANEAVAASQDANLEDLQLRQGQFDLDLLAQMAPRLESAAESLQATVDAIAANRSPWLLPLVDDQLQSLVDEALAVLPEAQVAAEAARVMPGLLGADGERRYLMFFGSPGESREFGGFIGGYALIGVRDGDLDLLGAGSINELVPIAEQGELDDPGSYPAIFEATDPAMFPQNLTSSPNIFLIARATRDVFPELQGAPIDGVIYADPFALAAMTEFTGPLEVAGIATPLDQAGVVDFIFDGQYRAYETRDERFGAIGALASATAANFEGADLPGPERLGEVLGPAARAGRLQVVTYDDDENNFLSSVRLQRHFTAPTEIDSFAVVQTNGTASKLDLFLHRTIRYDVEVDSTGALAASVEVELRSDMQGDIPPLALGETDGTNQVLLSLYSPHELTNLQVNGEDHEYVVHQEFGFNRYALFKIALAPNATATATFTLVGEAPPGEYRLGVWSQPLVNNDLVDVRFDDGTGSVVTLQNEMTESWLAEPYRAAPAGE